MIKSCYLKYLRALSYRILREGFREAERPPQGNSRGIGTGASEGGVLPAPVVPLPSSVARIGFR
jgi:hypothetical protein